ncbi:hypothetical protein [Micromonospora sp. WMMD987]|uniref:hypothetical protein n=1 Tax=Micromonospora sp. WMMD987 TaxID=3016089 RepID=UPI00249B9C56|nr:hypothetical protein [Micromonospora sp. WMMD987]WFE95802.1 hypothetical protein O7612_02390 [Micromonospora sp. WMMD987]
MTTGSVREFSRYESLVTGGAIRLTGTTTNDLDRLPRYDVPPEVSPLDLLLADRRMPESADSSVTASGAG